MRHDLLLEVLEELRPVLRSAGIQVELTMAPHRHGFMVYTIHAGDRQHEVSDPGEAIEYLHGLVDGVALSGSDPLAMLERAVRAAKKKAP